MSADDIVARLKATPAGTQLNWSSIRTEISDEYGSADTVERIKLLTIYTHVMDAAEHSLAVQDLETFRTLRRQDYNRLIVSECLIDGNVSPTALSTVTSREIEAGRMSPDDELRRLATAGAAVMPEAKKLAASPKQRWSANRALLWGAAFGACYTAARTLIPGMSAALGHSDLSHINTSSMVGEWIGGVVGGALMFAAAAAIINKVRRA